MYTWSQLGIDGIVNYFLYGSVTKPADISADTFIRSPGRNPVPLVMDAVSFMADGPGRFANPINISLVQQFMQGGIGTANGAPQVFTLSMLKIAYGKESADTSIFQPFYSDQVDDHASRTFIYGNSPFTISQGALFVIDADGARHIQNFAIVPYNDNFDWDSFSNASKIGNTYLKPRVDPTAIGRRVDINFDGASVLRVPNG